MKARCGLHGPGPRQRRDQHMQAVPGRVRSPCDVGGTTGTNVPGYSAPPKCQKGKLRAAGQVESPHPTAVKLHVTIHPSGLTALLQCAPHKLVRDKRGVQDTAAAKHGVAGLGARASTGGVGWWHQGTFTYGGLTQRSSPELLLRMIRLL